MSASGTAKASPSGRPEQPAAGGAPGATAGATVTERRAAPARVRVALVPARMPTNPYAALLARAVEGAGAELVDAGRPGWRWFWRQRRRVQVVHLHWLHVFYRYEASELRSVLAALGFGAMLLWARLLGYRLVWTLHNVRPHDSPTPIADRLARLAALNLAEVVIHCEAARPLLARRKLAGGVHAIPHGSYCGVYPQTLTRESARQRLQLDAGRVVFLAFGLIRGYKGLRGLVESFDAVRAAGGRPATLLVVGRPRERDDAAQVEALRRRFQAADIRWVLEFVPDDAVQLYMLAADYAVCAFESVLVSGSAILALSFGVPLVAPRLGCLPELLGETGEVGETAGILYDPPGGLSAALAAALAADRRQLAAAARARAAALDWGPIGRAHVDLYCGKRA